MGQHRSTEPSTWLSWDNYLIGVLGLVIAAGLGTSAAILADSGHTTAAVVLAVAAAACVIPAALQALGELLAGLLLVLMLLGGVLLLPALLVSRRLRRWAKQRWIRTWH
ncbi:hypothetical protein AB0H76_01255 [Nocardia sp. NPDC050712]|uniref:hypothetical protein n=1 Tax=Nocardia sp. NPDC050712 TaxID=3155518 RepID=UPI0033D0C92C